MNAAKEAGKIISDDREKTYGDPARNLRAIAKIWSAILNMAVNEDQVCLCMAGLKLARLANSPEHHDSQVDAIGYILLMERVQTSRGKPP